MNKKWKERGQTPWAPCVAALLCAAFAALWSAGAAAGSQPMDELVAWVEGLSSPAFGVAEARQRIGGTVKETRDHGSGFQELELVPGPGLARAVLEIHRGELIGVQLDLPTGGVAHDLEALQERWGRARRGVAPLDSALPQPYDFQLQREDFLLIVHLQPAREDAAVRGESAVPITDIILRRIPSEEMVPASWRSEDDLVALVRLALRPRPLEPVVLFGALGVFEKKDGRTITLRRVEARNVAGSTLERVAEPAEPPEVAGLTTAFLEPIAVDVARLAKKLGATRVEEAAQGPRLHLPRGELELELASPGRVRGLRIKRFSPRR